MQMGPLGNETYVESFRLSYSTNLLIWEDYMENDETKVSNIDKCIASLWANEEWRPYQHYKLGIFPNRQGIDTLGYDEHSLLYSFVLNVHLHT